MTAEMKKSSMRDCSGQLRFADIWLHSVLAPVVVSKYGLSGLAVNEGPQTTSIRTCRSKLWALTSWAAEASFGPNYVFSRESLHEKARSEFPFAISIEKVFLWTTLTSASAIIARLLWKELSWRYTW
ncbi:MAG: hypothetical protein JO266_16525 [Acidobacteria bacterium]|nr:hypothetical protein [Acidobacteriota bacterium]